MDFCIFYLFPTIILDILYVVPHLCTPNVCTEIIFLRCFLFLKTIQTKFTYVLSFHRYVILFFLKKLVIHYVSCIQNRILIDVLDTHQTIPLILIMVNTCICVCLHHHDPF
jgi:hypothetical protein